MTNTIDSDKNVIELYNKLKKNIEAYHPSGNMTMIDKAFKMASNAHKGQCRKSGEPFIIHPLSVAIILAELRLDKETIAAALLHDVVEDTKITSLDIENVFGREVMFLVEGVTKLAKFSNEVTKEEVKLESFRKLILAMSEDIRVIIIKLADRLHNMQTLEFQSYEKQLEISNETMDLYSPIAQRLGISVIKIKLEDLALKYLFPKEYQEIKEKIIETKNERDKNIDEIIKKIKINMDDACLNVQIRSEMKHMFSIYRKMINKMKTLDEIYDIFAIKIIVDSVKDCYIVMGLLHNVYKPIPGRFKDYIAIPKENMYQSLHTTLISDDGTLFEVQIKTKEMDDIAKFGILANWKYGEKGVDAKEIYKSQKEKSYWLSQILEWQKDNTDNHEFINLVKSDFNIFSETISCFTPKGDVKQLLKGSTVIDFAYAIHSDIGNKAYKAFVNGKEKNVDYVLNSGDRVEIIIKEGNGPNADWLNFVKTSNAKNKIRKQFKEIKKNHISDMKSIEFQKDNGFRLARCCCPVLGDDVIGVITHNRGAVVHRLNCSNIREMENADEKKTINLTWDDLIDRNYYRTRLVIVIEAKTERIAELFKFIYLNEIKINVMNILYKEKSIEINTAFLIESKKKLQTIINKIDMLEYVITVERV